MIGRLVHFIEKKIGRAPDCDCTVRKASRAARFAVFAIFENENDTHVRNRLSVRIHSLLTWRAAFDGEQSTAGAGLVDDWRADKTTRSRPGRTRCRPACGPKIRLPIVFCAACARLINYCTLAPATEQRQWTPSRVAPGRGPEVSPGTLFADNGVLEGCRLPCTGSHCLTGAQCTDTAFRCVRGCCRFVNRHRPCENKTRDGFQRAQRSFYHKTPSVTEANNIMTVVRRTRTVKNRDLCTRRCGQFLRSFRVELRYFDSSTVIYT